MFPIWFYELPVGSVKLLIWIVRLMRVLGMIKDRHLVFIGTVEDPK